MQECEVGRGGIKHTCLCKGQSRDLVQPTLERHCQSAVVGQQIPRWSRKMRGQAKYTGK